MVSNINNNSICQSSSLSFTSQERKKLQPVDENMAEIWLEGLKNLNECSDLVRFDYEKYRNANELIYSKMIENIKNQEKIEAQNLLASQDEFFDWGQKTMPSYPSWKYVKKNMDSACLWEHDLKVLKENYSWDSYPKIMNKLFMSKTFMASDEGNFSDISFSRFVKTFTKDEQDLFYKRWIDKRLVLGEIRALDSKLMGVRKTADYDARRQQEPKPKPEINEEVQDLNKNGVYLSLSLAQAKENI